MDRPLSQSAKLPSASSRTPYRSCSPQINSTGSLIRRPALKRRSLRMNARYQLIIAVSAPGTAQAARYRSSSACLSPSSVVLCSRPRTSAAKRFRRNRSSGNRGNRNRATYRLRRLLRIASHRLAPDEGMGGVYYYEALQPIRLKRRDPPADRTAPIMADDREAPAFKVIRKPDVISCQPVKII